MRVQSHHSVVALAVGIALIPSLRAEERFMAVVFGPASADSARQGARAAAGTARRWLKEAGASVEFRRAGSADALSATGAGLEKLAADTAAQARDTDPASFLSALDAAVQAAALHQGTRLVVAILNSPPLSSEAERTIEDLIELCRTKRVRIVVLDIAEGNAVESKVPLQTLAIRTGGVCLRKARLLEPNAGNIAAGAQPEPEQAAATPAAPPAATSPAQTDTGFRVPVHARFIRTSQTGGSGPGSVGHMDDSFAMQSERAYEANETMGPLRGLVMVECPLNALKFETDVNAGTYQARTRVVATVRNSKGEAVWSGQKEVNLHGPSRRMERRKGGSLFFMRGVTLPGGERYTLEAKVDDLLASTSGSVQNPVRPGRGVRGLMASDALFVRRFSGSVDRFEADQIFSYDGEALSPVLNPVFRAEDPIDLQLYVVLYPDVNGAQPDLNLELRRDGQVVARMPVQFKQQLRDPAQEGKFGTLSGKSTAIAGGRLREFPYLANMKGAKLGPGNYEAVISVRQGRNTITRNAAFRVTGSAPAMMASAAAGAAATVRSQIEEENRNEVVLPEIAPATLDSSGLAMDREEQKRLWEEAAKNALGYSSHLPNFRCTQETHRFTAPVKSPDKLKEADSFKDELMYEDGKESYRTVEVNGEKTDTIRSELKGVHSRGEFGSMLHGLFDAEVGASYTWAGRAMAMGVLCQVFEVEVTKEKSNFALFHKERREVAGYKGRIFIDEETGLVRRLTIEGIGLPKDFLLQSPSFSLDYAMVRIGAEDYLLPLRSVLQVRQMKTFVRNESVFRGYRRFDASSEVKFEEK